MSPNHPFAKGCALIDVQFEVYAEEELGSDGEKDVRGERAVEGRWKCASSMLVSKYVAPNRQYEACRLPSSSVFLSLWLRVLTCSGTCHLALNPTINHLYVHEMKVRG